MALGAVCFFIWQLNEPSVKPWNEPVVKPFPERSQSLWGRTHQGRSWEEWLDDLCNKDRNVRAQAAAVIRATLAKEGPEEVGQFITALGYLVTRDGPYAVPALRLLLTDPRPFVRQKAAQELGQMGSLARKAVPDLRAALQDDDKEVREAARNALKEIRDNKIPPG
jgi:HEAT repeat protein